MALVTLKEILQDAQRNRYAVGAFNIFDLPSLQAVIDAAEETKSPVIIQITAGSTVNYYGYELLSHMVKIEVKRTKVPVVLHLDHCKEVKGCLDAVDAGWTSVMIDASSFPFEENVRMTKEVVDYAHKKGVSVEGELGGIPGVEDDIYLSDSKSYLANPEQVVEFINRTGVDALAPAIGTAHGLYKGEPKIDFELMKTIASKVSTPLVVHGGTGLSVEIFHKLIDLGATKINVSTQLKHTLIDSTTSYISSKPDEYNPLKLFKHQREELKKTVKSFMEIFRSTGKA